MWSNKMVRLNVDFQGLLGESEGDKIVSHEGSQEVTALVVNLLLQVHSSGRS